MDSMKILTAREMRLVEASAVAEGLDYLRLMENAGSAAARVIRSRYARQRPPRYRTVRAGQ